MNVPFVATMDKDFYPKYIEKTTGITRKQLNKFRDANEALAKVAYEYKEELNKRIEENNKNLTDGDDGYVPYVSTIGIDVSDAFSSSNNAPAMFYVNRTRISSRCQP